MSQVNSVPQSDSVAMRSSALVHYFSGDYRQGNKPSDIEIHGYVLTIDDETKERVFHHRATGIKIWAFAVDLTGSTKGKCEVVFHYTSRRGFAQITAPDQQAAVVLATFMDEKGVSGVPDAFYGSGVYGTRRDPAWFDSAIAILYNNYYGAILKKGIVEIEQRMHCTEFVIPILVSPDQFTDVRVSVTDELKAMGITEPGIDRHGNKMFEASVLREHLKHMPSYYEGQLKCLFDGARDVIVVQVRDDDDITHAQSNLVHVRSHRMQGMREKLGPQHPDTLVTINDLASLLKAQGRLPEAEPLYREALKGNREKLGPQHPDTLGTISNLAGLLKAQGRLPEAEPLYREALKGMREKLGPQHPGTLRAIKNLAGLLKVQGRLPEAEPLYREALKGMREKLGPQHPDTLDAISNLAGLLKVQGRLPMAEALLQEALEGQREQLGPQHPRTLGTINNMAGLLMDQGRLAEAEPLLQEALKGRREKLGPQHPRTLVTINALASLLKAQGRLPEAEPLYQEALKGMREKLGPQHPITLKTISNLAELLRDQGRLPEAELLYQDRQETFKSAEKMAAHERFEHALKMKEEGTIAFKIQDWATAVNCYSNGAKVITYQDPENPTELDEQGQVLAIALLNNCAMARLKVGGQDDAAKLDCTKVLQYDSKNVKALFRRAQAEIAMGNFTAAAADAAKALELEPGNKEAELLHRKAVEEDRKMKKAKKQAEKQMFARMF